MGYITGMAMVYEVLVDPTRRRILDLLRERERSVNELVALLGVGQPGVSKHLRTLREAGLVAVRQDAQRRWYRLSPAPLAEVDAWLAPYRRLWADRLDALERHLDRHLEAGEAGAAEPTERATAPAVAQIAGATDDAAWTDEAGDETTEPTEVVEKG